MAFRENCSFLVKNRSDQCERAKNEIKSKHNSEFGSFQKAVTNGDGAWMTRGRHSQNFIKITHLRKWCIFL